MKNIAVILAGGVGQRLGLDKPKQFLKIAGKTILEHTVDVFQKHPQIDEIAIIIHHNYEDDVAEMVNRNSWTKVKKILSGGAERYESSLTAIRAYEKQAEQESLNLIFHDAVRPLVSNRIIEDTIRALDSYSAVDVAVPAVDTIIALDHNQSIIDYIPERKYLNRGQTPQAFHYDVIKRAYERALKDPLFSVTDDCGVVRKYLPDIPVFVVPGEEQNIKLTYPEDVYLLDKLFQLKSTTLSAAINLAMLNKKCLVIFGGNSGIGKDMANIAAQYGAQVCIFSRSTTDTDISKTDDVQRALQHAEAEMGDIDYIVNTAAILNREPLMHLSDGQVKGIIAVNYWGMVNVSRMAYPYLKKSRGQLLHFTSSSYTRGRAFYALYSSTKAAVVNFVQAIAEEWESVGVRVNCINPQRTKTPMRLANFGIEPENTLLKSEDVAIIALRTLLSSFSGEVVDIRI